MSDERARYGVPWDLVFGLTPHLANGTRENIDRFTRGVVSRLQPEPRMEGLERLPEDPRFLLVANHYQRPGLWILHVAALLTQAIVRRYGAGEPPVRWVVTANWPPWKLGPWRVPSPGDLLLPRVAHALWCYPVSFAGRNPAYTAQSLRRILRDAREITRPIGLFPEGVAGSAGRLSAPLPGVDRLMAHLAKAGLPVVPAGVRETDRLVVRFGEVISAEAVREAGNAAERVMGRVAELVSGR